jgi:hypothetical protein
MYWTGSEADIVAAEAQAAAIVTAIPETRDGESLPPADWITTRWAIPAETTMAGVWAIPAYPGMDVPAGCAEVEAVEWLETTYT